MAVQFQCQNDDIQFSDDDTLLMERLNKLIKERQWRIPTATVNFEPLILNYIDGDNGVQQQSGLSDKSSAVSIFEYFFNQELIQTIMSESNKYRRKKRSSREFCDFTITDIYSFIAIIIYMSIVHLPTLSMYWSTDPMYNLPFVRKIMPRGKFLEILRFLHFNDAVSSKKNSEVIDITYKIQPIIDSLLLSFQNAYRPGQYIVIDESTMLWKSELPFKQCNTFKQARFSLKTFVLAESQTGYIYNLKLCTGQLLHKLKFQSLGISGSIVLHLTKDLLHQGRTLFLDKWYSSPALYEILYKSRTNVCGTVSIRAKGMPCDKELFNNIENLEKGQLLMRYNETMAFCAWKDKKVMSVLTTMHKPCLVMTTKIDYDTRQYIKKPNIIVDYNKHMGGIDYVDQILYDYKSIGKSLKWYKKYFFHLIDITINNCLVIWNCCHEKRKTFREIKEDIISGLLEKYYTPAENFNHGGRKSKRKLPLRVKSRCFPSKIPPTKKKCHPTKRCVLCKETNLRKESSYFCKNCNVALCITPCFELFHSLEK